MTSSTPSGDAHICWLHGFAGSGKSAISLEIARIFQSSGRLLGSFFFLRGAGDRNRMNRFAVTLSSQLAAAIPASARFIEAAVKAEPGLLTDRVSLGTQLERLVYEPFQAAIRGGLFLKTLFKGAFLIVIDGLDECEDKQGVQEFIDHTFEFFKKHPSIPLRILIASRVEQHIRAHLKSDGVLVGNLDDHPSDDDIESFLKGSFQMAAKRDLIIQAYIQAHGNWPTQPHMSSLIKHIGGSFVLASTIFKFIIQPATEDDLTTPMDRLPLTLEINGLDALYAQTLARSQHYPHFPDIISTIALLYHPLPVVSIADLLCVEAFEVIQVLLNLQAILHVPGCDEEGDVTFCHTSLRDFLTTESRSGPFFVPYSYHLTLSYHCFSSTFERNYRYDSYGRERFNWHRLSFIEGDSYDFISEVERFKARQPARTNRLPVPAFLCSVLFYFLSFHGPPVSNPDASLYILTECAKQFVLAVQCPDDCIGLWLEDRLPYFVPMLEAKTLQFTKHTCDTLQECLMQLASAAVHPKVFFKRPSSLLHILTITAQKAHLAQATKSLEV
ncbi:hypothetical protein EST38_g12533 [Candolleomyces aberdarensis]|uniref:Nephrocystin 3-like N-terminal domain-containing protein n=1 Tax=Candolleomyces aberdarensis TaxID=2316362 RepID=A0A4Q2D4Q4_9AGAR|nr:hypothetical protein EST38_g12533 [Candolleomyces aberdarensis]